MRTLCLVGDAVTLLCVSIASRVSSLDRSRLSVGWKQAWRLAGCLKRDQLRPANHAPSDSESSPRNHEAGIGRHNSRGRSDAFCSRAIGDTLRHTHPCTDSWPHCLRPRRLPLSIEILRGHPRSTECQRAGSAVVQPRRHHGSIHAIQSSPIHQAIDHRQAQPI